MDDRRRTARREEVERNDRALLEAARAVVAEDGEHATVAAIATRAKVGVGSLYRRYRTKEELFQRLCALAAAEYATAAELGLSLDDPWEGFASFFRAAVEAGTGALGPIAGTIEVTADMAAVGERGDEAADRLVRRAQQAGLLRSDVGLVDVTLLIEQLGRSPLVDQLTKQRRTELLDAARTARRRLIAIALDGLRPAPPSQQLPGPIPEWRLFTERWTRTS